MTKVERLEEIMEQLEKKGNEDHVAALRWAIFTLIKDGHEDDV